MAPMNRRFALPDSLIATNTSQRGDEGVEWLRKLPDVLAECERRWSLDMAPPFPQLSYNYAAPAMRQDGTSVVVKVCFPDKEFNTEVGALRIYDGAGAVQLLDYHVELGALLLEQIKPGTMLSSIQDDVKATSIASGVMRRIRRPALADGEYPFPTVADWAEGLGKLRKLFGGGTGPFPETLVDEAEQLFTELLSSMFEPVVLHGDLHHFNILAAEREPWLAIDPKGVIGEAAYEVGALLRNPFLDTFTTPDLPGLLARRMDQLTDELELDRRRIRGWAVAQAVLSAWWHLEDSGDSQSDSLKTSIAFAQVMAKVR